MIVQIHTRLKRMRARAAKYSYTERPPSDVADTRPQLLQ
jgi:hypothetical protein